MDIRNVKVSLLTVIAGLLALLSLAGKGWAASSTPPLPPNTPRANEGPDVTRAVDCDAGQTIQEAVNNSNPGDTVLVSGACVENVTVGAGRRSVVIDGQGTATVNGPDSTAHTFTIAGQNITIRRFSSISGGEDGVHIRREGEATVLGNTIENTGRLGIAVVQGSAARIVNNIVQDNPSHGILVEENGSARIGFLSFDDTSPRPNAIRNNGQDGVNVNRSSSAIILSNTIKGNRRHGIGIFRASHADAGDNTIESNGSHPAPPVTTDGIRVEENSGVNLGSDTGTRITDLPNSTSVNNTNLGIRGLLNSYADGRLGTLNGASGAKSFDFAIPGANNGGCHDSLSP